MIETLIIHHPLKAEYTREEKEPVPYVCIGFCLELYLVVLFFFLKRDDSTHNKRCSQPYIVLFLHRIVYRDREFAGLSCLHTLDRASTGL